MVASILLAAAEYLVELFLHCLLCRLSCIFLESEIIISLNCIVLIEPLQHWVCIWLLHQQLILTVEDVEWPHRYRQLLLISLLQNVNVFLDDRLIYFMLKFRILMLIQFSFTNGHFAHSLINLWEFKIVLLMLGHLLGGMVDAVGDLGLLIEALMDHLSLHAEP